MNEKIITVWFSCGVASAVAAKLAVEKYGKNNTILVVNNPVKEEHKDNQRFLKDVEKWIGVTIIQAINSKINTISAVDVWNKKKYMSGVKGAPCTSYLKKQARYEFETKYNIDYHVLGFTADEKHRHERFTKFERANVLPILIDEGLTKHDCFSIVIKAGIKIPLVYELGYPNANCIGCVKSSSPTYWNLVRKNNPEIFQQRSEQSRNLKCRLVKYKGIRIYLDQLPEYAIGGKLKGYECGIFCDTE